mgnify:CR=1 FL=1
MITDDEDRERRQLPVGRLASTLGRAVHTLTSAVNGLERKGMVIRQSIKGEDRRIIRIAITDRRLLAVGDETVTYRYKDRAAGRHRTETVSGHEFIRRFLQHVLPAGFHKVRYYGLWHPARRDHLLTLRTVLLLEQPAGRSAASVATDLPEPAAPPAWLPAGH